MPVQIPPECQELLDTFEASAQAATEAHQAALDAQMELVTAQQAVTQTQAADIAAHAQALDDARAFVECLVPPRAQKPPTPGKPKS